MDQQIVMTHSRAPDLEKFRQTNSLSNLLINLQATTISSFSQQFPFRKCLGSLDEVIGVQECMFSFYELIDSACCKCLGSQGHLIGGKCAFS